MDFTQLQRPPQPSQSQPLQRVSGPAGAGHSGTRSVSPRPNTQSQYISSRPVDQIIRDRMTRGQQSNYTGYSGDQSVSTVGHIGMASAPVQRQQQSQQQRIQYQDQDQLQNQDSSRLTVTVTPGNQQSILKNTNTNINTNNANSDQQLQGSRQSRFNPNSVDWGTIEATSQFSPQETVTDWDQTTPQERYNKVASLLIWYAFENYLTVFGNVLLLVWLHDFCDKLESSKKDDSNQVDNLNEADRGPPHHDILSDTSHFQSLFNFYLISFFFYPVMQFLFDIIYGNYLNPYQAQYPGGQVLFKYLILNITQTRIIYEIYQCSCQMGLGMRLVSCRAIISLTQYVPQACLGFATLLLAFEGYVVKIDNSVNEDSESDATSGPSSSNTNTDTVTVTTTTSTTTIISNADTSHSTSKPKDINYYLPNDFASIDFQNSSFMTFLRLLFFLGIVLFTIFSSASSLVGIQYITNSCSILLNRTNLSRFATLELLIKAYSFGSCFYFLRTNQGSTMVVLIWFSAHILLMVYFFISRGRIFVNESDEHSAQNQQQQLPLSIRISRRVDTHRLLSRLMIADGFLSNHYLTDEKRHNIFHQKDINDDKFLMRVSEIWVRSGIQDGTVYDEYHHHHSHHHGSNLNHQQSAGSVPQSQARQVTLFDGSHGVPIVTTDSTDSQNSNDIDDENQSEVRPRHLDWGRMWSVVPESERQMVSSYREEVLKRQQMEYQQQYQGQRMGGVTGLNYAANRGSINQYYSKQQHHSPMAMSMNNNYVVLDDIDPFTYYSSILFYSSFPCGLFQSLTEFPINFVGDSLAGHRFFFLFHQWLSTIGTLIIFFVSIIRSRQGMETNIISESENSTNINVDDETVASSVLTSTDNSLYEFLIITFIFLWIFKIYYCPAGLLIIRSSGVNQEIIDRNGIIFDETGTYLPDGTFVPLEQLDDQMKQQDQNVGNDSDTNLGGTKSQTMLDEALELQKQRQKTVNYDQDVKRESKAETEVQNDLDEDTKALRAIEASTKLQEKLHAQEIQKSERAEASLVTELNTNDLSRASTTVEPPTSPNDKSFLMRASTATLPRDTQMSLPRDMQISQPRETVNLITVADVQQVISDAYQQPGAEALGEIEEEKQDNDMNEGIDSNLVQTDENPTRTWSSQAQIKPKTKVTVNPGQLGLKSMPMKMQTGKDQVTSASTVTSNKNDLPKTVTATSTMSMPPGGLNQNLNKNSTSNFDFQKQKAQAGLYTGAISIPKVQQESSCAVLVKNDDPIPEKEQLQQSQSSTQARKPSLKTVENLMNAVSSLTAMVENLQKGRRLSLTFGSNGKKKSVNEETVVTNVKTEENAVQEADADKNDIQTKSQKLNQTAIVTEPVNANTNTSLEKQLLDIQSKNNKDIVALANALISSGYPPAMAMHMAQTSPHLNRFMTVHPGGSGGSLGSMGQSSLNHYGHESGPYMNSNPNLPPPMGLAHHPYYSNQMNPTPMYHPHAIPPHPMAPMVPGAIPPHYPPVAAHYAHPVYHTGHPMGPPMNSVLPQQYGNNQYLHHTAAAASVPPHNLPMLQDQNVQPPPVQQKQLEQNITAEDLKSTITGLSASKDPNVTNLLDQLLSAINSSNGNKANTTANNSNIATGTNINANVATSVSKATADFGNNDQLGQTQQSQQSPVTITQAGPAEYKQMSPHLSRDRTADDHEQFMNNSNVTQIINNNRNPESEPTLLSIVPPPGGGNISGNTQTSNSFNISQTLQSPNISSPITVQTPQLSYNTIDSNTQQQVQPPRATPQTISDIKLLVTGGPGTGSNVNDINQTKGKAAAAAAVAPPPTPIQLADPQQGRVPPPSTLAASTLNVVNGPPVSNRYNKTVTANTSNTNNNTRGKSPPPPAASNVVPPSSTHTKAIAKYTTSVVSAPNSHTGRIPQMHERHTPRETATAAAKASSGYHASSLQKPITSRGRK